MKAFIPIQAVIVSLTFVGCSDGPKIRFFGDTDRVLNKTNIALKCIHEMLDYTRDDTWSLSLPMTCRKSQKCLEDHLNARDEACQRRYEGT